MVIDTNQALMMVQGLESECNRAIWQLTKPKGGQQVSFHGDLGGVPLHRLKKIKWWTREIRSALGDDRPEINEDGS